MYRTALSLIVLTLLAPSLSMASSEDESLELLYGDDSFVSIATGRKQLLSKAAAVASVITAEDIKKTGAKDIEQALESVAGLHVSRRAVNYNSVFTIRGIGSDANTQVLMLINGIPITNVFTGDRSIVWGGMPVQNISRIEVIRGPGSAVYGADAFSGTINIITKTADEIDGFEAGFSAGSFDTRHAWALFGGEVNGWDVAFSMELSDSNGHDETVQSDLQSTLDGLLTTNASLAPGGVNTGKKSLDTRIDLSKDLWRLRMGFQGRYDVGTGTGVNQSLDPFGSGESERLNLDLTYHDANFSENWDLQGKLSFFQTGFKTRNIHLFPPGAFSGAFPNGVIGSPTVYERHYRSDMSAFFTGFNAHDIRVGAGVYYIDQYRVEETKNFIFNTLSTPPSPIPLRRVSGADLFNQEAERTISYVLVQDEWLFASDWALTTGLRYDHYSDFGGTVNPRIALIYNSPYNFTTKLLYGRAFRAPSFAEQFNANNPVLIGNEDLDPEVIDTYEIVVNYAASPDWRMDLNLFYYEMEDIILSAPVAQNTGNQTGYGAEWEFEWGVTDKLALLGNYAYQHSEDENNHCDVPDVPQRQVYLRADYQVTPQWSLFTQVNRVMDRKRAPGDTRPEVDDYTTVDVSLRAENIFPGVDVGLSVNNLTDENAFEPSVAPGNIANDLPLAGRSLTAEISVSW